MNFGKALDLLKEGKKMKLPCWNGYWAWENNTIIMHLRDGSTLDIRETKDVAYTLSNIASDEWLIADDTKTPLISGGL